MTDPLLRALERAWRETGSVEAEAAYLRECVRAGALTGDRLALAALCGHPAAVIVEGRLARTISSMRSTPQVETNDQRTRPRGYVEADRGRPLGGVS